MFDNTAINTQRPRAMAVRLLAVGAALVLVSLLVLSNSRAAFTGETSAAGSWETGNVTLDSDASQGVLFDVEGMVPGDVVDASVTVTYSGSVDDVDVRLYGEGFGGDSDLAEALTVRIGTTAEAADVFDGTLADFAANRTDFDTGADDWNSTDDGNTRTYYFEVTFDAEAGNDLQEKTSSITFTWEAQS